MTVRPGQLLMFWDYDTQWGTDADRTRGLDVEPETGSREFSCTDRLIELHREFNVPACFAVVGAAALPGKRPYHDPEQIRRLHAAGHEIASHGLRHEWLPALNGSALHAVLAESRTALESCIGSPVTSFVPPYNQPFDHLRAGSISRSERRTVPWQRTDVATLCRALRGAGYTFCRVGYRGLLDRLRDRMGGGRRDRPVRRETIAGVTCVRLNTTGGFASDSLDLIEQAAQRGGIAIAYGHPHSLHSGNSQDERFLVPFLQRVAGLRDAGRLLPVLPRELTTPELVS